MDIVMDCLPLDFASISQNLQSQILELDAGAFGAAHAWKRQHFEYDLPSKTDFSFYATDGSRIQGYAVAFRQVSKAGDWVHLSRLAARNEVQQRGIGRRLMNCVFASAEQAQCYTITAEVDEGQSKAAGFYLKLGFEKMTSVDQLLDYLQAKGKKERFHRYLFGQQQVFIKRTV
jgi:ribosomal protein S18 acetylase RimI-like enzyme